MPSERRNRLVITRLIRALAASPTCPRAFEPIESGECDLTCHPTPQKIERCWRKAISDGRMERLALGRDYTVSW